MIDECEYEDTIKQTKGLYEGKGERFMEEEAIRNASLSAMTFMYAAKYYGYDTCPMIGFDEKAVQSELNMPEHVVPVLMITIGKSDTTKTHHEDIENRLVSLLHMKHFNTRYRLLK